MQPRYYTRREALERAGLAAVVGVGVGAAFEHVRDALTENDYPPPHGVLGQQAQVAPVAGVTWQPVMDPATWPSKLYKPGTIRRVDIWMAQAMPAMEVWCGPGDQGLSDGRERSQVGYPPGSAGLGLNRGDTSFLGVRLGFPPDLNPLVLGKTKASIAYCMVAEWMPGKHTYGNNSLGFDKTTGDLRIHVNGGGAARAGVQAFEATLIPAAQCTGVHDVWLQLGVGEASAGGGIAAWVDGKQVVPWTPHGTIWSSDQQLHPNFGLYRGNPVFPKRTHIYIANVRRCNSLAALQASN